MGFKFLSCLAVVGVMRSSVGDKRGNLSAIAHMLCKKFM